jgi:lysophospholipase L1-like esterase
MANHGQYGSRRAACTGLALLLGACMALAAGAAEAPSPAPTADAQCAYVKQSDASPLLAQMLDGMVKPGAKVDLAAMIKDPQVAALMRDMAEQDKARAAQDWAALCKYKADNAEQLSRGAPRVIFLGDSITEFWRSADPAFFSDQALDRGISGQTSSQLLLRFPADVVALHPVVVHLMVGTNDVAQNTGPISDANILGNIRAMVDLAHANRIRVVLASIPPARVFGWRSTIQPAERIARLNQQLRALAAERKLVFVDYYTALKDAEGGMRAELSNDGVHPNRNGYALMRPLAEQAIARAQRAKP